MTIARWGFTIPQIGVPLLAHADLVRALADFGYTDAWSAERNCRRRCVLWCSSFLPGR